VDCAIEHRTRWFAPCYEVRVGILFSPLERAIIETHKLYDHRVLTDLGDEIKIEHIYDKTLVKRFSTPALAKTFDENLRAALNKLKGYLEFSATTTPTAVYKF
jgi:hypothetical protein